MRLNSDDDGRSKLNDGDYSDVKVMHMEVREGGGRSISCREEERLRAYGLGSFGLTDGYWLSWEVAEAKLEASGNGMEELSRVVKVS